MVSLPMDKRAWANPVGEAHDTAECYWVYSASANGCHVCTCMDDEGIQKTMDEAFPSYLDAKWVVLSGVHGSCDHFHLIPHRHLALELR